MSETQIDWDAPPDGETLEEMERVREQRRLQEEQEAYTNKILWERYAGHYGHDGRLVVPIRPGPLPEEDG